MRWTIITIGAVAACGLAGGMDLPATVALSAVMLIEPAAAEKSKMGCEIGSEIWGASQGKCVPGTYTKKSAKKVKKVG